MTTRNAKTAKTTNGTNVGTTDQPVMAVKLALKRLDIEASSFFVAKKRHEYLRNAIGTRVSEETGAEYAVILVSAVERYEAERKVGGGSSAHNGTKKFALWLSDAEIEQAARVLSESFGRTVTIDRLYKVKVKGEAVNGTTDDNESDDGDEA